MGLKIAAWILVLFVCFQLSYSTSDFESTANTYSSMNIEDLLKSYKDELARLSKKNNDGSESECPCLSALCLSSHEQLLTLFYRASETASMTPKEYKENLYEILMDKCMHCLHRAWEKKEPKECMQDYHTMEMINTNLGAKIDAAKKQSDGSKTEVSKGNAAEAKESEDQSGVKFVNGEIDFSSTTMEEFIKMYESIVFTLKKEETDDARIYKECPCYSPECVPTHEEILSLLKRSDSDTSMTKEEYSEELKAYATDKCVRCLHDRNAKEDCLKSYDTMVHLMAMMFRKLQTA